MGKLLLLLLILFVIPFGNDIPVTHYPTIENTYVCQSYGNLGHVGVDLCVPAGTEVYAVLDGIVIRALDDSRVYGRHAMILHEDGYATLYAHLNELYVKEDDLVKAGDMIGLSGGNPNDDVDGDGWSSGAHLHFEVRVPDHLDNNLYNVNPLKWLKERMNSCYYQIGQNRCY